jgi:hypothetical protein
VRDRQTDTQTGDLISLLSFLESRAIKTNWIVHHGFIVASLNVLRRYDT